MTKLSDYWAKDYTGRPFQAFGPAHLTALLGVAALNVGWLWLGPLLNAEARAALRMMMAVTLLLNESVYHLWNWRMGQWTVQTMLPLHLCSVLVYLSAFMLVTRNYTAYEFCYFLGVGGASQALLTPDAGRYGFPHVRFFTTMISHGLLFSAPLYLTLVEGFRPTVELGTGSERGHGAVCALCRTGEPGAGQQLHVPRPPAGHAQPD